MINVEFKWSGEFAKPQSQKNIIALHNNFKAKFHEHRTLETSSKSLYDNGLFDCISDFDKMVSLLFDNKPNR
ncbi:DarT1-associated NADAR antitoxin family protein [Eubacterium sp.]